MPEVTLNIRGRDYSLSCDEGQEERLQTVGQYVNSRLSDISAAGAASNDSHLHVLTALVLADEVFDLRDEVARLDSGDAETSSYQEPKQDDPVMVQAIDHLANKIENIAERIQKA